MWEINSGRLHIIHSSFEGITATHRVPVTLSAFRPPPNPQVRRGPCGSAGACQTFFEQGWTVGEEHFPIWPWTNQRLCKRLCQAASALAPLPSKDCIFAPHTETRDGILRGGFLLAVLSSLNVDGLPYAATIGEEEFHVSNLTFEGLDSGIKFTFLADGGIL